MRYGHVAQAAARQGLALSNMGSLPHISVGGSSSTGTHGSGSRHPVLAASVRAIEMVTAGGDLLELSRESTPEVFDGAVLPMGSLGVFTHLTLDLVPAFTLRQSVYLDRPPESMSQDVVAAALDDAYSVSLFHSWTGSIDQIWVKQQSDLPREDRWHGARLAESSVHPLPSMPPHHCTDQSGEPGPSYERLPHFRMQFTPSSGDEIQSEYFVAREDLVSAMTAVLPLAERIRPLLHVSEVRTVAADQLWLSPAYERDSACIHFTWKRLPEKVEAVLPQIEAALTPFSPRPHWGKVSTIAPEVVTSLYPRLGDFQTLRDRLDPDRTFANDYVDQFLGA